MGWLYASRPEARLQPAFSPFAPANLPPGLGLRSSLLRGSRPLIAVAGRRARTPLACVLERDDLGRLQPYSDLRQDTHGVFQFPLFQFFPELGAISVAGIAQHHSIRQAPRPDLIDDFQRQFPFLAKDDSLCTTCLAAPFPVVSPALRKLQPPPHPSISSYPTLLNPPCHPAPA